MTEKTTEAGDAGPQDFTALLEQIAAVQAGQSDLTKALATDPEPEDGNDKIVAAAEEAGVTGAGDGTPHNEEGGEDGKGDEGGEGGGDADDPPADPEMEKILGKSFIATMPDGRRERAYDGTEAIRIAHARMDQIQSETRQGLGQIMKALTGLADALKGQQETAAQQIALTKSLQTEVAAFGSGGVGRKSALTIHDKPTASAPAAPSAEDIRNAAESLMAKALVANERKAITASEVARVEAARGIAANLNPDLVRRIEAAASAA